MKTLNLVLRKAKASYAESHTEHAEPFKRGFIYGYVDAYLKATIIENARKAVANAEQLTEHKIY